MACLTITYNLNTHTPNSDFDLTGLLLSSVKKGSDSSDSPSLIVMGVQELFSQFSFFAVYQQSIWSQLDSAGESSRSGHHEIFGMEALLDALQRDVLKVFDHGYAPYFMGRSFALGRSPVSNRVDRIKEEGAESIGWMGRVFDLRTRRSVWEQGRIGPRHILHAPSVSQADSALFSKPPSHAS